MEMKAGKTRASSSLVIAGIIFLSPPAYPMNFTEDFSHGMDQWWVEGGRKTWVADGKLYVDTNAPIGESGTGATVWFRQPIEGDVEIACTVQVVASDIKANHINFFLYYSMPDGSDLFESRGNRADGAYKHYHDLNGYIVTFLNDRHTEAVASAGSSPARHRIRRCPGFTLIAEQFDGTNSIGKTYHCKIIKKGTSIRFYVDGDLRVETDDPTPFSKGYFGLRTFATLLAWDNVTIRSLPPASP